MEQRPPKRQRRAEYSHNQAHGNSRQHNGDVYHFHGQAEEQHSQTQQAISQLSEDTGTRIDHVSEVLSSSIDTERAKRFLDTLHFDGLDLRREAVSDAAFKTFDWILDPTVTQEIHPFGSPALAHEQRMRLSMWLEENCETNLFWILGKAGSGKSTMMKFIYDDDRTHQLLERWAGESRKLITAQHFFWYPGAPLQKSIEGLLRSLLHQICGAAPTLIRALFPQRWKSADSSPLTSKPWNVRELWDALTRLRDFANGIFFCFFIDGLDECHPPEDHRDLVTRLLGLVSGPNVKICVSSRPRPIFESSADRITNRKLLLEDLTYNDLRNYAFRRISDAAESAPSCENIGPHDISELAGEIASSALGVFLWVRLVVSSIAERVIQGTDYEGLISCLREFPLELEDYFRHMIFERIHSTWHRSGDVAKVFKLAIRSQTLVEKVDVNEHTPSHIFTSEQTSTMRDWKNYHMVLETCYADSVDSLSSARTEYLSSAYLKMKEEAVRRKLDAVTGGLLTLVGGIVVSSHRTVFDFLATGDMQTLINEKLPAGCDDTAWFSRVLIAGQKMRHDEEGCSTTFSSLKDVLSLARTIDGTDGSLHTKALEEVAIAVLVNQCNRSYQFVEYLYNPWNPHVSDPLGTLLQLCEYFLRGSCFGFASLVIHQWPEILGENQLVWEAGLGLHGYVGNQLDLNAVNLGFLRLLLSHGADPRVGHTAFAQLNFEILQLDNDLRSSATDSMEPLERLLYQISYALLNDGASSTGNDRMNASDFQHLCVTTIDPNTKPAFRHPDAKAKRDEIAARRTSNRAKLWHPVSLDFHSQPFGRAYAVWIESLQLECWAVGVHDSAHTICGELEKALSHEAADLILLLAGRGVWGKWSSKPGPYRCRLCYVESELEG